MRLSQFKQHSSALAQLDLVLPNGSPVPAHFHLTEAGLTTKHTNCLAQVHCGIPADQLSTESTEKIDSSNAYCTPGGGCC